MIRVAMLTQAFHPRIGGAERQLLAVAPLLQARGVQVHVVTRRYPGLLPEEVVAGIPVHRVGAPGSGTGSATYTLQAQRLLRHIRPDVLHAYELLSPTTTGLLAQLHLRVPLVVKVLGGAEVELVRGRPLGRARLRAVAARAAAYQVVSDDIDRELAALGVPAQRRVRIDNGVDCERFQPPDPAQRASARACLGVAGPLVLFVGRLSPEKGVEDLHRAWELVVRHHPDATLLVAGDGPEGERLRSSAPARCRHLGLIEDVRRLMHAADLLVLPSHAEGSPNALLEAMAAGVPVVATAVGGSVELAADGRLAVLVPPARPDLLAAEVCAQLVDHAGRRRRASLARCEIVKHRSLPATADSLVTLYREVLASTTDRPPVSGVPRPAR